MEAVVILVGMTWVVIGVGLGVVMGRRGSDGYAWFVLGTLLGPLAVVLAVYTLVAEAPGTHRGGAPSRRSPSVS